MASAPVETKVVAASTSAALSTFVIAWLSTELFRGAPVPAVVVGLINGAAAAAFVAGWLAKHTPRSDIGTGTQPSTTNTTTST